MRKNEEMYMIKVKVKDDFTLRVLYILYQRSEILRDP